MSARSVMPPPFFTGPTCKGSFALGSACGNCERCQGELARMRDVTAGPPPPRGGAEAWDRWYQSLPPDLTRKLSLHDFKRLGDCFKAAFGIAP